jgi:hypothetical protein
MESSLIRFVLTSDLPSFGHSFEQIRPILFWVFASVFVLFGVVFPVLMFFGALLDKQRIAPLVPASERDRREQKVPQAVEAALSMEYRPLGLYTIGDPGKKQKRVFLLLSDDGRVLLRVWPGQRFEFMSRMLSGHWLITADTLPVFDLSGLKWDEMLPGAPLNLALRQHHRRLREAGQPCVPFPHENAPAHLLEHERQCVTRLKELRLARYVEAGQDTWSFTVRGALKIAVRTGRLLRTMQEGRKRVEALKQQSEARPVKL